MNIANNKPIILLVEDDARLANLIQEYLQKHGLQLNIEPRGDRAEARIARDQPDLVILDVMLPGKDGFAICRGLRPEYEGGIIMLTARDEDLDELLGTPLARLRFAVEMLRDKPTKTDADRFLNDIDRDVKEIESLIDEILLHSRYDRAVSEQSFERLDLVALLNELLEVFQDYHPQVILKNTLPDKELKVALDSTGIKHAMNNLLNNAARYAKSTIKVSLDKAADTINIKVEDDGEGIAKEDFQRVFKPFIRLDESRQRKSGEVLLAVPDAPSISTIPGGSGLGLSIVERIAQWHGGSVSCEKSDLGGAMFSFQIPLRS